MQQQQQRQQCFHATTAAAAGGVLLSLLNRRYTLLHVAAGLGQAGTLQLLLKSPGSSSLINDASNGDAATPLHAAAMAGSLPCVQLLLKQGADAALAGAGGLLPWEVATAETAEKQQQLVKLLQQAAGGDSAKKSPYLGSKVSSGDASSRGALATSQSAPQAASVAAGDGTRPAAAYSKQFAELNATEQGRKVDTFARMSEAELGQLDFLTDEAKQAVSQVSLQHSRQESFKKGGEDRACAGVLSSCGLSVAYTCLRPGR